jgi:hypothetical protein
VPAPLDIDRHIRFAIEHRRLIQLTYSHRVRIAEPHDYGLINHEPKLLVYQRREEGSTFAGSRNIGQDHRFTWDPLIARVAGAS